jgi:hypothetical protein
MFVEVFVFVDSRNGGVSKSPGTTKGEDGRDTSLSLEVKPGHGWSVLNLVMLRQSHRGAKTERTMRRSDIA